MWVIRITIPDQSPFEFEYEDIKDYRAFQKFWSKRKPTFTIEFLGKVEK